MVGDHQIGRGQPLRPRWLGGHPRSKVLGVDPPLQCALETDVIRGVDHHAGPEKAGVEDRHLDHRQPVKSLQLSSDRAEYVRVGQGLQFPELARIGENDASQPPPIDDTIAQHLRPAVGHGPKSPACRLEHPVAHSVGIDHPDPGGGQETADFGLSRADSAREQPTTVLCSHLARR